MSLTSDNCIYVLTLSTVIQHVNSMADDSISACANCMIETDYTYRSLDSL